MKGEIEDIPESQCTQTTNPSLLTSTICLAYAVFRSSDLERPRSGTNKPNALGNIPVTPMSELDGTAGIMSKE